MRSKVGKGLTLVELLVTLLTVAILVISVPMSFRSGTQVWGKGDRHAEVLQNGLIGIEEMTRELRQAKSITDVSGSGDPTGYIEFENKDGYVARYQYNDTASEYLQCAIPYSVPEDLNSLAGPAASLTFTCYEQDGVTETTIPDDIGSVVIQLVTSDSQGQVNDIPLCSRVYIRDLILKPRRVTDEFAIFGDMGVDLRNGVGVGDPGNVGSNGDIYVRNNSSVNGNIIHLGGLDFQNSNRVDSGPDSVGYIEMPCITDFSVLPFGGPDISKGNNETTTLAPGSYGTVELGNFNILNLSSGNYYLDSFLAGNTLTLNIDLTSGQDINIFVIGRAEFGNNLEGSIETSIAGGGPEQVYAETHFVSPPFADPTEIKKEDIAWWMGKETTWLGTVYAPYGHIYMTDGTIQGALYSGGYVIIHNVSDIEYWPSNYLQEYGYACYD